MSTAEILSLISTISYILAVVCLTLAVFFFFKFQIPSVIGDLSGRTAKKSIARMRDSNEKAGGKGYRPSAANVSRGKLTETMTHAAKPAAPKPAAPKPAAPKPAAPKKPQESDIPPETRLLAENEAEAPSIQETTLLGDADATGLLEDPDATTLLEENAKPAKRTGGKKLVMLDEVMLIHTDEVLK